MEQFIKKSALLAEIERLITPENGNSMEKLLDFIDTFEMKEVDLEKEIQDHIKECLDVKFPTTDIELIKKDVAYTARRFFELGLRKGQKNIWHYMDETPNYPCEILLLTNVDNMFLYRYMENGRPVDRETPYFGNILNGKCWCYCNDVKAQKGERV